jgi:kynurenine formamidase
MRIIDLTLPLDQATVVFEDGFGYRDPPFEVEPWATIQRHGYAVHRLTLGTHTGTHFDAPAHFFAAGRTVEQVPPSSLVGRAVVIDVRHLECVDAAALAPYREAVDTGSVPLFLASAIGVPLDADGVRSVLAWQPRIILYAGTLIDQEERYYHNRTWLRAGIPLVTDLDPDAAQDVVDGDLLIVAPLKLAGLDGSPCRVFAVRC